MNTRSAANSQRQQQQQVYYASPLTTTTSSHSICCKGCCCCLFLLLSFIALLVLAALLVIVLAVKPKRPQLDLSQVGLQYMAIAPDPGPISSAKLYLLIRLVLAVVNPNGVGISCGESRVTLLYRGTPLGRTTVSAFWQHPHSVKEVVATVRVDHVNLSNAADGADFTRDALLNDRVELRVLAHVATKIRLLNLPSPPLQVSVNCVIVISPRKQILTYKQCGFKGLNV